MYDQKEIDLTVKYGLLVHVTNERLYQRVNQVLTLEMIHERQLKFTSHCIRMPTGEPINRFVLYEWKIAVNKHFVVSKKKKPPDLSYELE